MALHFVSLPQISPPTAETHCPSLRFTAASRRCSSPQSENLFVRLSMLQFQASLRLEQLAHRRRLVKLQRITLIHVIDQQGRVVSWPFATATTSPSLSASTSYAEKQRPRPSMSQCRKFYGQVHCAPRPSVRVASSRVFLPCQFLYSAMNLEFVPHSL